ncbi:ACP S-malonyltransferase [Thermochromatium tepidum]|uniref:Malonyl CoA-acyl carrier protein transacylase n=1 Tax=Thermochromatium tepidum ATCC 43061 TaxID=316276 RepID=A0A6I6EDQ8_THETI|nr:ACP S-malonyltransferase [Thermochromatium tepidum]QGU33109.1 ACP S-malonyltransferase [Thermochromatium tepidum ATCC 43061]
MTHSLAVFFPGQGSQSVGMLDALAEVYSSVKHSFEEASDALGRDLWSLVTRGPKEDLDRTENTQPAMLAAGIAVWRVWQQSGGPPATLMAGHSLGEYTALVAAGALGFAEAIRLASDRARFMQEAVPAGAGAMAAVLGLADEQVVALCAEQAQGEVLAAVNFNSPGQVVIAGASTAVARAIEAAKAAGAKRALLLPVSVPSHCALMRPAAERLAERLAEVALAMPSVPVIHNVTVAPAADVDSLRRLLVEQLYSPVRWVETIESVVAQGVTTALECGPGKVLTGLNKRISDHLTTLPVFDPKTLEAALEASSNA